ncbi:signal peptidase I [Flavobacterium agricola]|uniref:Signal peptidase I n=1 Tax=Flavobacterium agricola TaxID=2870839 RepID=A0ABY6LWJ5_9FLAO|nr:signal peptidase I [Flavobacterium agricola]UYW00332.1 signal peptidase I [Flavobacterium agricola]
MTILQWFIFFLVIQLLHFLGTWKLYEKAGRKPWEAAVPVYNAVVLMKIIDRPKWWTILLFIPIINLILFGVIWVEIAKAFGKKEVSQAVIAVVTLGFYNFYLNYFDKNLVYTPEKNHKFKDNFVSSLLFAVVVATFVHTYFIQPFTIPTSSLEKTLLVGDFLFVSKFHYGARNPMTTVAVPMVHDTVPVVNTKSYLKWPSLPYFRLPGISKLERNDIAVFNWPVDTVRYFGDTEAHGIIKPIDKKSNYVKRTVGIPGDKFAIKDGIVYVNGEALQYPDRTKLQYSYTAKTDGTALDGDYIVNKLHVSDPAGYVTKDSLIFSALTQESVEALKALSAVKSVDRIIKRYPDPRVFPYTNVWNDDQMDEFYIPEKGKTVELNAKTIPYYRQIIKDYEGNTLTEIGDEIRINGVPTTKYTFKQDYYFMMGDNRHNSEDSRYWGFVPEDHIVGKPIFIWMSIDSNPNLKLLDKMRWDRFFTTVSGSGEPKSYFGIFIIALLGYFTFDFFRKRKKNARRKKTLRIKTRTTANAVVFI